MKTFHEWLELREAGFFSGLFGKKAQPVQQPQIKQSEEDKERERQRRAYDDAMALLVPGYKPKEMTPEPQQKPAQAISRPGVASPQSAPSPRQSSGTTLFDQLYDLVGGMIGVKNIKLRSDRSLGIEANRSDLYEAYSSLSQAKNVPARRDEAKGLSDSEVDQAISIIEKMFNEELGLTAFPDEEVLIPWAKSDYSPKDYRHMQAGIAHEEEPSIVVVKGFRGRRTLPARVHVGLYRKKYGVQQEEQ
jgi:hypothetical protein